MTLFDKFFSNKAKLFDGSKESRDRCNKLNTQVRLLLFKECDTRGRKVLFDSATIERVKAGKDDKPGKQTTVPCIVEVTNGYTYLYKGPSTDTPVLGEMIFGAVAVNHKGVALKIHIIDDLKRLMCTKVFSIPSSRRIRRVDRRSSTSDRCDVQADKPDSFDVQTDRPERTDTKPVNVPRRDDLSFNFSFDRGDSGFYGEQSVHSSVSSTCDFFNIYDTQDGTRDDFYSFNSPPGRKLSSCSTGSWQRRTFRSLCNKFDFGNSSHLLNVPTSDSQIYSNSSASGTSDSLSSGGSASLRRSKLGLALLITVQDDNQRNMIRECLEHSVQLESLVCRLRLATLKAGAGNQFVHTLYNAAKDAEIWVRDLVSGPRLSSIWTSITSDSSNRHSAADMFLNDLCSLIAAADTKHTNFFMSTLLTHLLTYHLGWVTTVSPYDVHPRPSRDAPSRDAPPPYNALWAQLHDLCGTIGHPPKAARTLILGHRNAHLINKLLLVLTYFMRCGDVERMQFKFNDRSIQPELASEVTESDMKRNFSQKFVICDKDTHSSDTLTNVREVKSNTFSDISDRTLYNVEANCSTCKDKPNVNRLKKSPSQFVLSNSSSSLDSDEFETEKKVVFVLGENEKLVGLKNKSVDGKRVKKSSKIHNEPVNLAELSETNEESSRCRDSPSKCCSQTSQHSKPLKHSGFKFEFDKYPQIVINYMKSKNLEILDRHLIGKPGNLKLDNYLFDPSFVAPIQEEKCESCHRCEQMESIMQTPTNASEFEYMNDVPRITEPQYAKETLATAISEEPKTFLRKRMENTVIVNVTKAGISGEAVEEVEVVRSPVSDVVKFGEVELEVSGAARAGFDHTLLGGVTDHYVPDYILQGVLGEPSRWQSDLRRDLELTTYLNKTLDSPIQAVAIVGDIDKWEVRVESGGGRSVGGMSVLVGAVLDTLPALLTAHVPTHQCISFVESKLREFCVLSKTLADLLMTKDFCDIETLTRSLNIDVNDVPLLMAVATTHTPQVATRYGISYR